ncbi:hypothetical protein [uncultured Sulfitobacter sp.]|uniref:hypothetical protein n=1 Tax=uncultured Sulfitobacter sp. TaxID=191468 RepID=UPI002632896A|nr:hypothetical protein [uncultured Sulfitobacter sp.]
MSKVEDLERSIGSQLAAVQMLIDAMIVEGIRTKNNDETKFMILLEQGLGTFKETFGAIGTFTSVLDIKKCDKNAKLLP